MAEVRVLVGPQPAHAVKMACAVARLIADTEPEDGSETAVDLAGPKGSESYSAPPPPAPQPPPFRAPYTAPPPSPRFMVRSGRSGGPRARALGGQ